MKPLLFTGSIRRTALRLVALFFCIGRARRPWGFVAPGMLLVLCMGTAVLAKSVVNDGDVPIEVEAVTESGRVHKITVPPGQSVALPPGTKQVWRSNLSQANSGSRARGAAVRIEGDGQSAELPGNGDQSGVLLDPKRPGVVRPTSPEPIDTGREGAGSRGAFTGRQGKTVVNRGTAPVEIEVELANGGFETITVPPGTGVALPPDTKTVTRSNVSTVNTRGGARDAPVSVEGDGQSAELPGSGDRSAVRVDPKRPEVVRTAGPEPVDPDGGSSFPGRSGKTVVNRGAAPVEVDVQMDNGTFETITVPPGTGVALPPDTKTVSRSNVSRVNTRSGARDAQVSIEGDGLSADLSGKGYSSTLQLDSNRPEVVRNADATPIRPDPESGIRITGPEFHSHFANEPGKTVVNHGTVPVEIEVELANGIFETITVPPGMGVALPPGTIGVFRDNRMADSPDAKDSVVRIAGDGLEVELSGKGEKSSIRLDPERPEMVRTGEEPGDGIDIFAGGTAGQRGGGAVGADDGVDIFAGTGPRGGEEKPAVTTPPAGTPPTKKPPEVVKAPADAGKKPPPPEAPKKPPTVEADPPLRDYKGTIQGEGGAMPLLIKVRGESVEAICGNMMLRGTLNKVGGVAASFSQTRSLGRVRVTETMTLTGQIKSLEGSGRLTIHLQGSDGTDQRVSSPWTAKRVGGVK